MEKMIWAKPEMNEVAFAANEYVAACGTHYVWTAQCLKTGTKPNDCSWSDFVLVQNSKDDGYDDINDFIDANRIKIQSDNTYAHSHAGNSNQHLSTVSITEETINASI